MKWTYIATVAVAAMVLAAPGAQAQGGMGMGMGGGGRMGGRMGGRGGQGGQQGNMQPPELKGITLSDAQKDSLKAIDGRYRTQMEALRNDTTLTRQSMMTKAQDLHKKQDADIRAQLTADQQKTFDKNVADMEARMKQMQARMQQMQNGGGNSGSGGDNPPPPAPQPQQ